MERNHSYNKQKYDRLRPVKSPFLNPGMVIVRFMGDLFHSDKEVVNGRGPITRCIRIKEFIQFIHSFVNYSKNS